MSTLRSFTRALLLGMIASVVLCAADSLARPGGGHSFSSSSSSSSSFGGGGHSFSSGSSFGSGSRSSSSNFHYSSVAGDDDLFTVFLHYPVASIPVVIFVLGFVMYSRYRQNFGGGWDSGGSSFDDSVWDPNPQPPPRVVPVSRKLTALRTVGPEGQGPFDPAFSLVVFEDFVYALYARAQQARDGRLDELAPWVSEPARQLIQRDTTPVEVGTVVIGAMKYLRVTPLLSTSEWIHVTLEFEANYTERLVDGREHSFYVVDRWRLSRRTSAKSRPPDRVQAFDCPNCGAASTELRGDTCAHCGTQVGAGRFDWVVSAVELVRRDERGPQLTGDVEEVGTDFPTIVSPEATKRLRRLETDDASFTWADFERRVRLVFKEMYDAWSSREWLKARPYLSDNLFQMQSYWVDAYKRAGLTNQLLDIVISEVELARVVRDPYFDSITVRVRASGVDITVADRTGRIVSGSRNVRRWTEYWTFIRGVGVQGKVTTEKKCPNCGAELQINMAGNCEYCQAKVTSGQFDWVLSRIEQDETYQG